MRVLKLFSVIGLLLFIPVLFSGCGGNPTPAKVFEAGVGPVSTPALPGSTTTNGITAASQPGLNCLDVKSPSLNIGTSEGQKICLEATVTTIKFTEGGKARELALDTATGKNGTSLYKVGIYIPDVLAFGPENMDYLYQGVRVRVKGIFSQSRLGEYILKVTRGDELEVLY